MDETMCVLVDEGERRHLSVSMCSFLVFCFFNFSCTHCSMFFELGYKLERWQTGNDAGARMASSL